MSSKSLGSKAPVLKPSVLKPSVLKPSVLKPPIFKNDLEKEPTETDRLIKPNEPVVREFFADFYIKYSEDNINEIIDHMFNKKLFPYAVIMKCPYIVENFDTDLKAFIKHKESTEGKFAYFNYGLNRLPIQKFIKVDNIINHENDMVMLDDDNINYKMIEYVFSFDCCGEYIGCNDNINITTKTNRVLHALETSCSESNFNYYYGCLLRYALFFNNFHCTMNTNESLKILDKFEFYILPIEFESKLTENNRSCYENLCLYPYYSCIESNYSNKKMTYELGKIVNDKLIHVMI
jgi:hypothetical protein